MLLNKMLLHTQKMSKGTFPLGSKCAWDAVPWIPRTTLACEYPRGIRLTRNIRIGNSNATTSEMNNDKFTSQRQSWRLPAIATIYSLVGSRPEK
jgi:hypothetical protein